ncbi:MAG: FAD-dependent oxidoreductase [Chloroflexi bacterium]|nr:FAD-dependent oxidoreductase [Chloroflexota bacterium]
MKLFEPGKIGKLHVKNRIVLAPISLGPMVEPDGRLSQRLMDLYVARARGGTGMIITTSAGVTREIEQPPNSPFLNHLMADDAGYVTRFSELSESVHEYGSRIVIQLTIGLGHNVPPYVSRTAGAVGPSPNPTCHDPAVTSRELTVEEIQRIVRRSGFAGQVLSSAGIDGIQLNVHAGHLLDEFTCSLWNKRTDKYGGDLDGRLRLSVEIIEAIKRAAGADFPVIIKFGLTHYIPGGREIEEGLQMARKWEAAGVDALIVDAGCHEARYWMDPPTTLPMGCWVGLAAMVKQVVKIPVIAGGKLGVPELAEAVLQEGKADFIALGRPLLADPEWANKVKEGKPEDIVPCIGDLEGCHKRGHERKYQSCTVNPACGMESEFTIEKATKKKSVLVVGGGPGGMEAARVAALRGHRVSLWEKGHALGGNLIAASVPELKQEYRTFITYLSTQLNKLGVETSLAREATPELIEETKPEVVFVATGSTPVLPDIPGAEKGNVAFAVDLLLGKREAGRSVVVIGGGTVGCEAALYLAQQGRNVTIVEMLDRIMDDTYFISREHLLKLLEDSKVKILVNTRVVEITDGGVVVAGINGRRTPLPADTVLLAAGMKSNDGLVEAIRDRVPEVYAIGDCVRPRRVINAVWEGFHAARMT